MRPTYSFRAAGALSGGLVLLMMMAVSCSAPVHNFTHTQADMSFYQKVGVIPFRSLTADAFAGEKFSSAFVTALLSSKKFDVVDPGVFANTLKLVTGARIPEDALPPEELKKIGDTAGVQGIFIGSISQYDMASTGAGLFPVITVEVRFIDVNTGTVIWSASASERGGPKTPIVGINEVHTLGELSDRISREMVDTLK